MTADESLDAVLEMLSQALQGRTLTKPAKPRARAYAVPMSRVWKPKRKEPHAVFDVRLADLES